MKSVTKKKSEIELIEAKSLQMVLGVIKWINLIPFDFALPDGDKLFKKLAAKQHPSDQIINLYLSDIGIGEEEFYSDENPYPFENIYTDIFEILMSELKDKALALIVNIIESVKQSGSNKFDEETFSTRDFYTTYENIRLAREFLLPIALETTHYARHKFRSAELAEITQNRKTTEGFVFINNRIKFNSNPLKEAVENIDADKLRICEICQKIFWANRIDKWTCSTECGQNSRIRKFRQKGKK